MKQFVNKILFKICRISPNMGNLVMDILGYERYCKMLKANRINRKDKR